MTTTALNQEIRYFDQHRREWLAAGHGGKFVVVCGGRTIGFWPTLEAAAQAAERDCRGSTYLLRQVQPADEVQIIKRSSATRPAR